MALAVTHVILTIVIVSLYRHYLAEPKFSRWYVLLAGVAGLLPDLDYPLSYLFPNLFFHGMFHMIWVVLILLIALLIVRLLKLPRKYSLTLGILAFGFAFHLLLDCTSGGYEYFLPFSAMRFCPNFVPTKFWPAADSIILILWLTHEYYANKIKDFF